MTSDEISFIFAAPHRDQVLCRHFTHSPIASCSHEGHALLKVLGSDGGRMIQHARVERPTQINRK